MYSSQGPPPPNMPHGLPPTCLSQGLPMAQPAISGPPSSALHLSSQAPGFAPPSSSAGVGASSYPPAAGVSRPSTAQGASLPGQAVPGIPASQPNHVTSPPPMAGPPSGPPLTGFQGQPPPTHPSQPGYQMQQNGMFSAKAVGVGRFQQNLTCVLAVATMFFLCFLKLLFPVKFRT